MSLRIPARNIPLLATIAVFVLLYGIASARYPNFFTPGVFVNFFSDNAFLGIAAVGMTFVILSGGIDLSVGAIVGLVSIVTAVLIQQKGMSPAAVIPLVLMLGTTLGAGMGALIRFFGLPPFLVTLAGMFLARGLGFVVSVESVAITHPWYTTLTSWNIALPAASIPLTAILLVATVLVGIYIAQYTRFGRNVYAIGGNQEAATLMGLPVSSTTVLIYALSGFCSALAGVVYTLYSSSGNANTGLGLEMDAIATVVIGGTLLTGGVGSVAGTLMGVLIYGIIQTAITFEGTLSSWWTRIAVGLLLFIFVGLQKLLTRRSTAS